MTTTLVATICGVWFVATVVSTTTAGRGLLFRSHILARVIPQWNFFAPMPNIYDYAILYRRVRTDGRVEPWTEAVSTAKPRPWWAPIWNPEKYSRKALFDQVQLLVEDAEAAGEDFVAAQLNVPYLAFLHHLSHLGQVSENSPDDALQFTIVRLTDPSNPEVLLVSALHAIEA